MAIDEIHESNAQWVDWARRRASALPAADLCELPGLTVAWGGGGVWLCNSVFLSGPVESLADFDARLRTLLTFLETKPDPPFFVVCQNWIPATWRSPIHERLVAAGFRATGRSAGMAADRLRDPPAAPPQLTYRPVAGIETQYVAADINSAAHGFSIESGRAAMARSGGWGDDFLGFVGYSEGVAAATCSALLLNGAIHVLRLATQPGMQRRGFGEAVLRRAVDAVSQVTGVRRTTLHSTEAGNSLYLRLGYREVAEFRGYTR
jgi:ribosomal protein S18 acetylase RimI-like enzyme